METRQVAAARYAVYAIVIVVAIVVVALVANALSHTGPEPEPQSDQAYAQPMEDDFSGDSLDLGKWTLYNGPATNGRGTWDPNQVRVEDGQLLLVADGSKMGGLCLCGPEVHDLVYADVSFTVSMEPGEDVYLAGLMWPEEPDGQRTPWPTEGEIDIIEINDYSRQSANYNIWWGTEPDNGTQLVSNDDLMRSKYPQFKNGNRADFTKPQEVRLEWRPGSISIYHAGKLVFRTAEPEILDVMKHPMHLALQLDMPEGAKQRSGRVVARVDNVKVTPIIDVSKKTLDGPAITAG